ncbi:ABC transporter substrate-binding protein [Hymenobacter tenuis]
MLRLLSFCSQALVLAVLAPLVACQPDKATSTTSPTASATSPQQLQDDLGRQLTIPANPRRIMALAASMTEMLYAVADTSTIIGRTEHCDFPAAVVSKPIVTTYPLDFERLVALHPDVIFTTDGITSLADAARLQELGIPVYYQRYNTVEDLFQGLQTLGRILGRKPQAQRVVDSLRTELTHVTSPKPAGRAPRVLAITWHDPIYVYGQNTLFTDKIKLAGGQNVVQEKFAQPYPALSREYILKLNPDILIGGRFGKMDSTFFKLYPELKRIRAYQTRQVYDVTDNLMSRPTPRVVQAVRELRALVERAQPAAQ